MGIMWLLIIQNMKIGIKKIGGFALITLVSALLLVVSPFSDENKKVSGVDPTYFAEVVKVSESVVMKDSENTEKFKNLDLKILNSDSKGKQIELKDDGTFFQGKKKFEAGDQVIVGKNNQGEFYIKDLVRSKVIYLLFGIFIFVVLAVTGWQGIGSILGMLFSFLVLFRLVLPGILVGQDPLLMAISGALLIIPGTFFLSHGFSRKTSVAVVGTLITLIVTGLLSLLFAKLAVLSGLAAEETSYLNEGTKKIVDFRGLLLAGMIISVLGIMDDITISQSSMVQQLINAKKKISFYELYRRAMHVGRDHIASMVNTLVLVYAGASLALLLLFIDYSQSFIEVINYEFMAQEIIQTLLGSIGLILAVPLTTLMACWFLKPTEEDFKEHNSCGHVH